VIERPVKLPRIWLRSFYWFSPEEDGFIGWTSSGRRDRMLALVEDGDLFMIYGAASSETQISSRNKILGFLQIEKKAILDTEKASETSKKIKRDKGWEQKWTYALPVVRAWRADESILLERIATETYQAEQGQAIASWSPPLNADEVERALRIKVTEVNVFGEPPLTNPIITNTPIEKAFEPSRGFPASFGKRAFVREDGPVILYLARFENDGFALLGRPKPHNDKSVLMKIGISKDLDRRCKELNSGFPPASTRNWFMALQSVPYINYLEAEAAEQSFKNEASKKLQSQGGEFFFGDWTKAETIFALIPGVSRFGS
jgi:hypothetical protein